MIHSGFEYSQLLLHGTDNDMFESLAVETVVVPSKLQASPTNFWVRTLAKPIPSVLWKGKPVAPEEHSKTRSIRRSKLVPRRVRESLEAST